MYKGVLIIIIIIVPSFYPTEMTVSESTANGGCLKIIINFRNITGEKCNTNKLVTVSSLFSNIVLIGSDSRLYSVGRNVITFCYLASGTTYGYQIDITEGDRVLSTFSGQSKICKVSGVIT